MKVITKKYEVFSFDELSEKAKENAINSQYDISNEDYNFTADADIDDFIIELHSKGLKDAKIRYTGFNSQGDGLSFSCSIDILDYIKKNNLMEKYSLIFEYVSSDRENCDNLYYDISNNGHYCHSFNMRLNNHYSNFIDYEITDELQREIDALEKHIIENAIDTADGMYKQLEKMYYDYMSADYITERIKENELTFLADGSPF